MFPLLQTLPDLVIALAKAEQAHIEAATRNTEAAACLKELRQLVEPFIAKDDPRYKK